jgi:AIR synthase-related protein
MRIAALAETLRAAPGLAHKADLAPVLRALPTPQAGGVRVGDDCAAIPDGDGYLLFAIEGFLPGFVAEDPYFAGYCGVMVNLSDVAAMGGRPIAVVDALWSPDQAQAGRLLAGLGDAARIYGVPVVGGHSNVRAAQAAFSVAVLGRARVLLDGFAARAGDLLIAAIDLRGRMRDPHPFWDASTGAPAERLRGDLELLPRLAEDGLCRAGKDISNAGLVGTAAMLLECSGVGACLDLSAVPRPDGVALERWLLAFPSFGFLLAVRPGDAPEVLARFAARDIAAAVIGVCDASLALRVADGDEAAAVWDFRRQALLGAA